MNNNFLYKIFLIIFVTLCISTLIAMEPSLPNYYTTLGIPFSASQQDVKKAYKGLALINHPDMNIHEEENVKKEREEKFKRIDAAYKVLYDPEQRKNYDQKHTSFEYLQQQITDSFQKKYAALRETTILKGDLYHYYCTIHNFLIKEYQEKLLISKYNLVAHKIDLEQEILNNAAICLKTKSLPPCSWEYLHLTLSTLNHYCQNASYRFLQSQLQQYHSTSIPPASKDQSPASNESQRNSQKRNSSTNNQPSSQPNKRAREDNGEPKNFTCFTSEKAEIEKFKESLENFNKKTVHDDQYYNKKHDFLTEEFDEAPQFNHTLKRLVVTTLMQNLLGQISTMKNSHYQDEKAREDNLHQLFNFINKCKSKYKSYWDKNIEQELNKFASQQKRKYEERKDQRKPKQIQLINELTNEIKNTLSSTDLEESTIEQNFLNLYAKAESIDKQLIWALHGLWDEFKHNFLTYCQFIMEYLTLKEKFDTASAILSKLKTPPFVKICDDLKIDKNHIMTQTTPWRIHDEFQHSSSSSPIDHYFKLFLQYNPAIDSFSDSMQETVLQNYCTMVTLLKNNQRYSDALAIIEVALQYNWICHFSNHSIAKLKDHLRTEKNEITQIIKTCPH